MIHPFAVSVKRKMERIVWMRSVFTFVHLFVSSLAQRTTPERCIEVRLFYLVN